MKITKDGTVELEDVIEDIRMHRAPVTPDRTWNEGYNAALDDLCHVLSRDLTRVAAIKKLLEAPPPEEMPELPKAEQTPPTAAAKKVATKKKPAAKKTAKKPTTKKKATTKKS